MNMAASEHEVSGTSGTSPRPAGPAPEHEHEPPTQRIRVRGYLGRWVMAAVVTVVVAALAAVLLGRVGVFTMTPSAGSDGASTSWQTYHDSFGLFTLRVPPGWTAQTEPATTWYLPYERAPVSFDMVSFDDPVQGTGSAFVWITAYPIKTALARQYFCQHPSNLQRFAPLTLRSMEPGGYSLFTTETASFQVDVGIPGVLMPARFGLPWPAGTPLPATWVATDKSEVNAMLVSFQPMDPKPLTC